MEEASRYQERQQGCPAIKRRIMATKYNGRNHNDQKETIVKESNILKEIKRNTTREKKVGSSTKEGGWFNLGRRWSGLHRRKGLCTKQQEDTGRNSKEKS